jgi:uncharacterized OB-fold protein
MVAALSLVACAPKAPNPGPPTVASATTSTPKGGLREQEITVRATVEKVDQKERLVTLRGPDGNTDTIRVGPEVKNLPQLKRGDEVIATYYQSVAFQVVKSADAKLGISGKEGAAAAPIGSKPGAMGARVITLVADIVKLDRANQQAMLKGPEGKTITVNVQNPENFDKVKVGDRVEITLTEAIAIDVRPAEKR